MTTTAGARTLRVEVGGLAFELPFPKCATCNKSVHDFRRMDPNSAQEVVLTAWCHGRHETARVPASMFTQDVKVKIRPAFLPPGHVRLDDWWQQVQDVRMRNRHAWGGVHP